MKQNRLPLLIILATISWILGTAGIYPALCKMPGSEHVIARVAESCYLSLQLFTLDFPEFLFYSDAENSMSFQKVNLALHTARITSPLLTIATILSLITERLRAAWILRCIQKQEEHTVIYGFNLRSRLFIENTAKRDRNKTVVVDPNLTEQDLHWITSKKCLPLAKDGASLETPELCRAEHARFLIALHDDDSQNMKVLIRAYQRNEQKKATCSNQTHCYIHFKESTYRRFQYGKQVKKTENYFNYNIFNTYELIAKKLALSIYKENASNFNQEKQIEFAIVGFGRTGQAIAEQLVRLSYFDEKTTIKIKVFSDESLQWDAFSQRFPVISDSISHYTVDDNKRLQVLKQSIKFPEITFENTSFENSQFTSGSLFLDGSEENLTRIGLVCLDDAPRNLALSDALIQQQRAPFKKVYVRSDDPNSEIRDHVRSSLGQRKQIRKDSAQEGFPPLEEICCIESILETPTEKLAELIHQKYFEKQKKIDPNAQQASNDKWENIPEIYRVSNILAAAHIEIKCCLLGICGLEIDSANNLAEIAQEVRATIKNPEEEDRLERLSRCEHNRWCAEKLLDNWLPGVKRIEKEKRHHNLVPWDLEEIIAEPFTGFNPLDETDKAKDRNTITSIPEVLEHLDAQLKEKV